jgi:hypothetical protein
MPHSKCVRCKTRLYSAAASADLVGDLCPGCGSLLEPVGDLTEIVGFRSITARGSAADDGRRRRHQRIADRVDLLPLREAILAHAPRDGGLADADADAATVKAVRSYERHHRDRRDVRAEVARVIPTARANAGQGCARKDKAARVKAGIRSYSPARRADLDGRRR